MSVRPPHTHPRGLCTSLVVLGLAVLLACNDPSGVDSPYLVTRLSSASLSGTPGWAMPDTLLIEVRDVAGHAVPGATVTWSLANGGSLSVQLANADDPMTGTTDGRGRSYAVWTLGLAEGPQVATVAAGLGVPASFTATATALHARSAALGYDYACAVLTDQRPVCWGANYTGQLGVGDTLVRASPTVVVGLGSASQVVASFYGTTCARDLAGDVWCWGSNALGEGGSLAQPKQLTPIRVPGADGATELALGHRFTCAVLAVGGGKCWGTNYKTRMGTGQMPIGGSAYPDPSAVIGGADFVQFGLDGDRGCAADAAREVWCWGNGNGDAFSPMPSNYYNGAIQPVPGHKAIAVAVNVFTTCGVGLSGEALCFGGNFGLGHDSGPHPTIVPLVVLPGESFAQIVTDGEAFYGRTKSGGLFTWGSADCCGFNSLTPGPFDLPVRVVDVAAGGYGYCVVAESGALYCDLTGEGPPGLKGYPAASFQ